MKIKSLLASDTSSVSVSGSIGTFEEALVAVSNLIRVTEMAFDRHMIFVTGNGLSLIAQECFLEEIDEESIDDEPELDLDLVNAKPTQRRTN